MKSSFTAALCTELGMTPLNKTSWDVNKEMVLAATPRPFPPENDETVRVYANRLRSLWRKAEWDKVQNHHVLYDQLWVGLHPSIKARVKPPATGLNGGFNSIDKLIDKAADTQII
jgi:hypothetical protein